MRTDTLKLALWGAVGGAIAVAIIGFSWGGWVTGGSAELTAKTRSAAAVVTALAPICASQFKHNPDAAAQQTVLIAKGFWEQRKLIETADWAKMPGSTDVAPGVRKLALN